MILFLLKGLLRDRSRSLFPVLVVTIGVMLTVVLQSWIDGVFSDVLRSSANFSTGHVRIMSRAYAEDEGQIPNDLALMGVNKLTKELRRTYPRMIWVRRIRFGGLLDVPDNNGETRSQGPVMGMSVDLLSPSSPETATLNLERSLVRGHLPEKSNEMLIGEDFSSRLGINPGDTATLLGSTMHGSMTLHNFVIAGTVRFGVTAMDRGAMLTDLADTERALDMQDAAGEVLGYFRDGAYHDNEAISIAHDFNARFGDPDDEFAPVMFPLRNQRDLGEYLDMGRYVTGILSSVFILAMSIVLWNLGLIGGLRRYGEVGLRLAIGEEKGRVYRSILMEAMLIGFVGSVLGTAVGLGIARLGEVYGLDFGNFLKNSSMMIPNVMHTRITTRTWYIGFIPGLFSTLLGSALSGIGIYRRETAQLFKELEI